MSVLPVFVLVLCLVTSFSGAVVEDTLCVGEFCHSWDKFLSFLSRILDDCKQVTMKDKEHSNNASFLELMQCCLKKKSLYSLDQMLELDVIPLTQGMELIRYFNRTSSETGRKGEEEEWRFQVLDRLADLLRTHALRFNVEDDTAVLEKGAATGRIRHRHYYRHLFPLMVVGFMMMMTILVPLGFQFMAVIGGKALLLSKMALMLSSAQAMKRVTSAWFDVYHSPSTPMGYGHIHRSYHQSGQHHDQDHDRDHGHHRQQQWTLGHGLRHQQYPHSDLGQLVYATPEAEQQTYQALPAGYTYATDPQQFVGWN